MGSALVTNIATSSVKEAVVTRIEVQLCTKGTGGIQVHFLVTPLRLYGIKTFSNFLFDYEISGCKVGF